MIGKIDRDDLWTLEGPEPNHMKVDRILETVGGGGWDGFGFKVRVLRACGYDVDVRPIKDEDRILAYNKIAQAINDLGKNLSAKTLLSRLGLA